MKRRDFNKALAILGSTLTVPPLLTKKGLISPAGATVSARAYAEARAVVAGEVDYAVPAKLPTVINVFMYGGPSELAGNLSNIADINANSQNKYPADMLRATTNNNGQITKNNFWAAAGGTIMETMIAAQQMTLYRTVNRIVDDSKAHRTSIFSTQIGGLNEEKPRMGTTLAAILRAKHPDYQDVDNPPLLPFVSMEGETVMYNIGDISLPLPLRPVSLDNNFNNPYKRIRQTALNTTSNCGANLTDNCDQLLDTLAKNTSATFAEKYSKVVDAFNKRSELDLFVRQNLGEGGASITARVPNNAEFTGSFGNNLKAAVLLAMSNPDTALITLSTGGLGGWDNHDNAITGYAARMQNLMSNLQAAMNMLAQPTNTLTDANGNVIVNSSPARNDVIINCWGEFGRNVNLNASMGWDHGNNMNLYTFGGNGLGGRQLGKLVGKTERIGTSGQNRQFTSPTGDSYQFEPMCIASSLYSYFGVLNPERMSANEDTRAPAGFGAINEGAASEFVP